jgi:hypothetical protein
MTHFKDIESVSVHGKAVVRVISYPVILFKCLLCGFVERVVQDGMTAECGFYEDQSMASSLVIKGGRATFSHRKHKCENGSVGVLEFQGVEAGEEP